MTAGVPPGTHKKGDRIGDFYEVEGAARGGMGVVYFVRDVRFGRTLALKTLRPEVLRDEDSVARFIREAELWLALDPHLNVLRLITLDRVDGMLHILCEFVDGGSLLEWIKQGRFTTLVDRVRVAFGIADGMAHIHARGMLHRDLKPANVLMTKDGVPKVCDFGLARPLAPGDTIIRPAKPVTSEDSTAASHSLGTPNYMPPEQWVDARKAGPPADVYAFGATLYELIYGTKIYRVPSGMAELSGMNFLRKHHMEVTPAMPPEPALPASLRDLLLHCLKKKPEERVAGFDAVCDRLAAILVEMTKAKPARAQAHKGALDPESYFYRGLGWGTLGRRNQAIDEYTRAIQASPTLVEAYANRGRERKEAGDLAGALADYNTAIELRPGYALAYTNRGVLRAARRDANGALEDFTKALAIKPDDATALLNRGSVRIDLRDAKGALEDLTLALKLRPDSPNGYNTRGLAHRMLQNADAALADFTRAIELNPRYVGAWYNRAVTKSAQSDNKGAIDDFSKVLELDPNDVMALYNRGACRSEMNDFANAVADFDKAIQVKADYAPAYMGRGTANLNRGRKPQAKADLEKFLQLAPQHRLADQAREWLKTL
jgi:tetratricopeptide (TPR) repeat protein